jgi:predicted ester cyclase
MTNKAISARFFELYGVHHDVESCVPLFKEDAVIHHDGVPHNLEAYKQLGYGFLAGMPDLQMQVLEQIEEGDRVATRILFSGTHTDLLNGIPATGRRAEVQAIAIDHFSDGRIVERWVIGNTLEMLQQLGVIPAPGS